MMHKAEALALCRDHLHRYVRVQTVDGYTVDGIIEHVDDENVYLAVPIGEGETGDWRQYYPPYYSPFYSPYFPPYYPGYYPPYYPRRRFRRIVLPLAALLALSLIPYY